MADVPPQPRAAAEPDRPQRLPALEGLRGIAAVLVLLSHLQLAFFVDAAAVLPRLVGPVAATFLAAAYDGTFPVWVFWVLSGFVLALTFHATADRTAARGGLVDAAIRRYPRLLPPVLASTLLAWALLAAGCMSNDRLAARFGPAYGDWLGGKYRFAPSLAAAARSGAWDAFVAFDPATSYNPVLWTMEAEFLGSIALFAWLALVGKHRARWALSVAAVVSLHAVAWHRFNAFLLGSMLAEAHVDRRAWWSALPAGLRRAAAAATESRLAAAAVAAAVLFLAGLPLTRGVPQLYLAVAATALAVASGPAARLLATPLPTFLGTISFGLYLVHLPLLCALAFPLHAAAAARVAEPVASVIAAAGVGAASLVGGWCLWRLADRPAPAFARAVARAVRPASSAAGAAGVSPPAAPPPAPS